MATVDGDAVRTGFVGVPYRGALSIAEPEDAPEDATYEWASLGALPPGLALSSHGEIAGTPTTAGSYEFAVSVTGTHSATADVVLEVLGDAPAHVPVTLDETEGEAAVDVYLGDDSVTTASFRLDSPSTIAVAACPDHGPPSLMSLTGPSGTVLGDATVSADTGCSEIDPRLHESQEWAIDAPAGEYTLTLRAAEPATEVPEGSAARALAVVGRVPVRHDLLIGRVTLGASKVTTGSTRTCAIVPVGRVRCWGFNMLGNGRVAGSAYPVDVPGLGGVTDIKFGGTRTCAIVAGGRVKCWGENSYGQLGDGSNLNRTLPVEAAGIAGASVLSLAQHTTCAIVAGGRVKCWGRGDGGQLGNGSGTGSNVPVEVAGVTNATALSSDTTGSCAIVGGGKVRCWGSRFALGERDLASVEVPGVEGATALARRNPYDQSFGMCAIVGGGRVRCWGGGWRGELGNGSSGYSWTAVEVSGMVGATQLAIGTSRVCAIAGGGTVHCWGLGSLGEESSVPVAMPGITGATWIESNWQGSCVLVTGGRVKCWGVDDGGSLGSGTGDSSSTPVDVVDLVGATSISSGNQAGSCAVVARGGIKCWGWNGSGRIGDGTTIHRNVPVDVVLPRSVDCKQVGTITFTPTRRTYHGGAGNPYSEAATDVPIQEPLCGNLRTTIYRNSDRGKTSVDQIVGVQTGTLTTAPTVVPIPGSGSGEVGRHLVVPMSTGFVVVRNDGEVLYARNASTSATKKVGAGSHVRMSAFGARPAAWYRQVSTPGTRTLDGVRVAIDFTTPRYSYQTQHGVVSNCGQLSATAALGLGVTGGAGLCHSAQLNPRAFATTAQVFGGGVVGFPQATLTAAGYDSVSNAGYVSETYGWSSCVGPSYTVAAALGVDVQFGVCYADGYPTMSNVWSAYIGAGVSAGGATGMTLESVRVRTIPVACWWGDCTE